MQHKLGLLEDTLVWLPAILLEHSGLLHLHNALINYYQVGNYVMHNVTINSTRLPLAHNAHVLCGDVCICSV